MATIEPILEHVVPISLVFCRLAGLFIALPIVGGMGVPVRAKVLLAVALSAAIYPTIPHEWRSLGSPHAMELLGMIVGEALVGGAMGLIAAAPMHALEMAGILGGQSMGLGLARVYNPELDADADVLGQMLMMVAGGALVWLGGLEWMFVALARTFETLPPGGILLSQAPLGVFVDVLSGGCELAMRVSLPMVGTVLLLIVAIGAVGKTMPQINVMNIGFALKVAAGLAMLAGALLSIERVVGEEAELVLREAAAWAGSLGRASAE